MHHLIIKTLKLLLFTLCLDHSASAKVNRKATAPTSSSEVLLDMDFSSDVTVRDLADWIGRRIGKNILTDQEGNDKIRIICPKPVNKDLAYEIFLAAIEQVGYSAVAAGPVTKILKTKKAIGAHSNVYFGNDYRKPSSEIVTLVLPLVHLDAAKFRLDLLKFNSNASMITHPQTNSLIITDNGYDIKKILKIVTLLDVKEQHPDFKITRLRYRDAGDTLELLKQLLKDEPGAVRRQVVERAILDQRTNSIFLYGNKAFIEQALAFIWQMDALQHSKQSSSKLRLVPIYFGRAEKLAATLKAIPDLSRHPKTTIPITFDEGTNSILFWADQADYNHIQTLIKKLDTRRIQVLVEFLFLEMGLGGSFTFGGSTMIPVGGNGTPTKTIIGWEAGPIEPLIAQPVPTVGSQTQIDPTQQAQAAVGSFQDLSIGVFGPQITVSGITLTPAAFISMLRQDNTTKTLNRPAVIGSENEEATVAIGRTLSYLSRETNTLGQIDTTTEKEKIDMSIKVKPKVNGASMVTLELDLTFNQLAGFDKGLPQVANRHIKHLVIVKDAQTAVLSGMHSSSEMKTNRKVPILGDVPIFGAIFNHRETETTDNQMLIFMTPHIILKPKDMNAIFEKKLNDLDQFAAVNFGAHLKDSSAFSDNKHINGSFKYNEDL